MKRAFRADGSLILSLFLCAAVLPEPSGAQVPGILSYQGRLVVNGTNFDGAGQFKFALVNGVGGYLWSNDGNQPPVSAVSVPVSKGAYTVLLGDTSVSNMTGAISPSAFTNTDVRLRVWFGTTTNSIEQQSPDLRIAAVGFAMMTAQVATNSVTQPAVVGGYVDLVNSQTIAGVKLISTNLLIRKGTNSSEPWSLGVGHFIEPGSGDVHSNLLMISRGGTNQVLLEAGKTLYTPWDINADGDISGGGNLWIAGAIEAPGVHVAGSNITAAGSISGHDLHADAGLYFSEASIETTNGLVINGSNVAISGFLDCSDGLQVSGNPIQADDGLAVNNGGAVINGGLTVSSGPVSCSDLTVYGGFSSPAGAIGHLLAFDATLNGNLYCYYAQTTGGGINCGGDLFVNGNILCSGTKYFVVPDPDDAAKEIAYICLEGPEAGTYVRGSAELVNGTAEITLPEHFAKVTSPNGLTVQVTPHGAWLELYTATVTVSRVTVQEVQGRSGSFDYLVQGVRIGYENPSVVRDRVATGETR